MPSVTAALLLIFSQVVLKSQLTSGAGDKDSEKAILLIGGEGKDGHSLNSIEWFFPRDKSRSKLIEGVQLKTSRADHFSEILTDGTILVGGGWTTKTTTKDDMKGEERVPLDSTEILDLKKNSTRKGLEIPGRIRVGAASAMLNGDVFLCGGGGKPDEEKMNSCFVYYSEDKIWEYDSKMNVPRSDFVLVEANGTLFAIGGKVKDSQLSNQTKERFCRKKVNKCHRTNAVEKYIIEENKWVLAEKGMPSHRSRMAAAVLNNFIYVCGGFFTNECKKYDLETEEWDGNVADMKSSRYYFTLVAINERLVAISEDSAEEYDPEANVWTKLDHGPKIWREKHTALVMQP